MIVLYLCAQLAILYTYNCLLIMIYYRLGQNLLILYKYAVRSRQGCNARKVISKVYTSFVLQCTVVLSLGGNGNTRRMSKPDMGYIFYIKINEIFWS